MDTLLSVLVGLGLAAACGFRVFVPVLVLAVAGRAEMVELGQDWSWLSSWGAIIALGTAATLEVCGYWIPWVDHALDTIASPAAVIAGTIVAASQMADLSPMLKWSAALIAGGGLAGIVQIATVTTRAASSAITGGVGNPVVSSGETAMAGVLSIGAIIVPAFVFVTVIALVILTSRFIVRNRHRLAYFRRNNEALPITVNNEVPALARPSTRAA